MNAPCKLGFYFLAVMLLVPLPRAFAQDDGAPAPRKLVKSPKPAYPNLARTMNLSGTVRVEVLVEPNGSVKSLDIKGGNPLLAQSAQSTIREWKWAKAEHPTTEILEIHFTP
jgi:TonB family protein